VKKRIARNLIPAALGALALLLTALVCAWRAWERAPETNRAVLKVYPSPAATAAPRPMAAAEPAPEPDVLPEGEAIPSARQDGVYTLLLVGNDDGNYNTDTLILGRIDTVRHRMDFVSIPRDTLINSPWDVRKINAVYWGSRLNGGDGITALKAQIARLTGFEPDCWAVADLELFVAAVDCIGGVRFEVPMAMDYEDQSQNLAIHLQPGEQLLDGEQAMGLVRYRSGYLTGDLGRIEMQQDFLRACAGQFVSLGSIPHAPELLGLLAEGLETDLSAANLAFLLRQLLSCRAEDIRFHTAPCATATISGYSYAVLELEPWLRLVNECLNPFDTPIGPQNVDLVYPSGGSFAGTAGLQDADYYRPKPAPAPVPAAPAPEPAAPSPTEEPEPEDGRIPAIIVVEP
jgi:LCP family protein required for cell wall assembly